jgi:hypothetical protein
MRNSDLFRQAALRSPHRACCGVRNQPAAFRGYHILISSRSLFLRQRMVVFEIIYRLLQEKPNTYEVALSWRLATDLGL